jgi:hypothetical protein
MVQSTGAICSSRGACVTPRPGGSDAFVVSNGPAVQNVQPASTTHSPHGPSALSSDPGSCGGKPGVEGGTAGNKALSPGQHVCAS